MLVPGDDTARHNRKSMPRTLCGGKLNLELLGQPFVIIVKQRDPLAPIFHAARARIQAG